MADQIVRIWGVRAFAGDDYEKAVVAPAVRELLHRFDERVAHFTVALTAARATA